MAASVDDLMSAAQMRPILAVSKLEPVSVSLGLTADKNAAVLVSKKLPPKKVRTQMRTEAKKLKLEIEAASIRFGTAVVDEEDTGLLLFRVNKAPSGALATKVRERMRKASWSKVEFVVDESLEAEADAEEGAPVADGIGAAGQSESTDGVAAGPAMDPDALLQTFRDAKDEVDAGLNRLSAALRATGDADLLQIADYGLYGMADGGGVGMMKALFDLRGSRPEQRPAALKAAQDAAVAYKAAVLGDNVIDLVDDNPFGVEVGIKSKLVAALDIIARAA